MEEEKSPEIEIVQTTEKADVPEEPKVYDKEPLVNVREDIGQSDLDIIYDKFSHSNPLHEFNDLDINYEFKNSIELSEQELASRKLVMEAYLNGEGKPNQNPAR
jgi:hypothetical protein